MRVRFLNNFVAELLNIKSRRGDGKFDFRNPRDGWIHISSTADVKGPGYLKVLLTDGDRNSVTMEHREGETTLERMLFLSAGEYEVRICSEGCARLKRFVVKAVPEIIYCKFGYNPHVRDYGPYNKHRAWMNYHVQVFKAKAETATLIISDWLDDREPGGPPGQETAINFIEIQPYLGPVK